MPTNFELKRYKPKLDIVEKPENRVHKLTDSNGARSRASTGESSLAIVYSLTMGTMIDDSTVLQ